MKEKRNILECFILPMILVISILGIIVLFTPAVIARVISTICMLLLIGMITALILTDKPTDCTKEKDEIYFSVLDGVEIPTKNTEDAGYDIYANFEEDYLLIKPHETRIINTGVFSALPDKYAFILQERGSTGTKGIAQRCGVIDSGYRGEWMIPITNTTDYNLFVSKLDREALIERKEEISDHSIIYPYNKAICQARLVNVPNVDVIQLQLSELKAIESLRGEGKLGSSGK